MFNRLVSAAIVSTTVASLTPHASAFTGEEMMTVFNERERSLYIAGLVDMAAWQFAGSKQQERAECVLQWFYTDDLQVQERLENLFVEYPNQEAGKVTLALIGRTCPDDKS